MKRVLVALPLALVLVAMLANPAQADLHGRVCDTYNGPQNHSVKVCISTNQHNLTKNIEGLVEFFDVPGKQSVDCLWVDHVALWKNGTEIARYTPTGALAGCDFGMGGAQEPEANTTWKPCQAGAAFHGHSEVKIRWYSGESSTWKIDNSTNWTPTSSDCNG